jgi:catechol 2,3-dioxygenase-like lactoylglutathione lyase family enzyme
MRQLIIVLIGAFSFSFAGCGSPSGDSTETGGQAMTDATPVEAAAVPEAIDPMSEFGTTASNVFFYYEDVEAATDFYREVLGLRVAADYGFAKIMQVTRKSFITLVDASEGMHSADEPKTAAIALVTDQLDEWWDYLQTQEIEWRSTEYNPKEGSAHDGFVAIDPEGYYLEFERFNPHPENEDFMPALDATPTLYPVPGETNVPEGLGFKATVVWFYYKDMDGIQAFYEDVLGFDLIVDQGWAKIYPVSPTGYFGLVDETLGMHNYTEDKAVTMSFFTADIEGWWDYLNSRDEVEMRHEAIEDDDRYRAVVAYDPEGYFLEWDIFNEFPGNEALLEAIAAP